MNTLVKRLKHQGRSIWMEEIQEVIENAKWTHFKEIIPKYSQTQDKKCPYVLGDFLLWRALLWNDFFSVCLSVLQVVTLYSKLVSKSHYPYFDFLTAGISGNTHQAQLGYSFSWRLRMEDYSSKEVLHFLLLDLEIR